MLVKPEPVSGSSGANQGTNRLSPSLGLGAVSVMS